MSVNWYRDMAFYQIWPRSFKDGDGDGIGDLYGVYDKLEYIKSLGVDGIWFSPLYVSPLADYGYDIADYRNIAPEYGGNAQFKKVLDKAHELGLKVIMDLVVNHSSDEHEWFKKSRDKNSKYHDYYFWRKGRGKNGKKPPNNWDSLFEGKAWQYDKEVGEYYLHLFAIKQADLNMDNPAVREEVKDIMRFWLDMGVDGFREDVITFISKKEGLPNDHIMPASKGLLCYNCGPHVHEYLSEFRHDVLDNYDCFVIGEAAVINPKLAKSFIADGPDKELDMMFHFQHMCADCLLSDYYPLPFSLRKLKRVFRNWQYAMQGKAWNALYIENHDHPRVISRYGSEKFRVESGKMLAASYIFQQGTPFVYQGQEIGMLNLNMPTIDSYKDVATLNQYKNQIKHKSPEKAMKLIRRACRDSARTPVQWDSSENAGFTTGEPWYIVNENYKEINVASQENDPGSLLNFYRAALKLRRETPVLLHGRYDEYQKGSSKLFVYSREDESGRALIICSFSKKPVRFKAPRGFDLSCGRLALANYDNTQLKDNGFVTKPYETRVYIFDK